MKAIQLPLPAPLADELDTELDKIERVFGERLERLEDGRFCRTTTSSFGTCCSIFPARTFEEYVTFRVGVLDRLVALLMPEYGVRLVPKWDKIREILESGANKTTEPPSTDDEETSPSAM